jgi:hypothetical protein
MLCSFSYHDRVTTSPVRPVVLRNGVGIEDPLRVVLGFLKAPGRCRQILLTSLSPVAGG